jgi:hypothetical protein
MRGCVDRSRGLHANGCRPSPNTPLVLTKLALSSTWADQPRRLVQRQSQRAVSRRRTAGRGSSGGNAGKASLIERLDDPGRLEAFRGELSRDSVDGGDPPAAAVASGEGVARLALDAVADEYRRIGRLASGRGLRARVGRLELERGACGVRKVGSRCNRRSSCLGWNLCTPQVAGIGFDDSAHDSAGSERTSPSSPLSLGTEDQSVPSVP